MICQEMSCKEMADYKYYVADEPRRFACSLHMQELRAFMTRFGIQMDFVSLKQELDDHVEMRRKLKEAGKEVVEEPPAPDVQGAQSGRAPGGEQHNVTNP